MYPSTARLSSLLVAAAFLDACEADRPLAPSRDLSSPQPPELAASATTSLRAPSSLTATPISPSRIDLNWQDNSANESGFEVQRSATGPSGTFTVPGTTGPNLKTYSDVGLTPTTQYCFKVRGFKTSGGRTSYSPFSGTSCTATPSLPQAPSNTDATPLHSSAIKVTWTDNSGNENGFRVEYSASAAGPWELAAVTAPSIISIGHEGRISEQQICYHVIAFNSFGNSPSSDANCTIPPAGPSNLTATPLEAQGFQLTWEDHSGVEDGYQVQRAVVGAEFNPVADLRENSTTYDDPEADVNTSYQYRVLAKRDGGFSDQSNVARAGPCVPVSATEICGTGEDNDCDGAVEEADPDCQLTCNWNQCPSGFACDQNGYCFPHCGNGVHDGDESDVDCGGSACARCQSGQHCWVEVDCASASCVNNICQP